VNIVCVIGARGGSKGVAGKNIRPLLGKPLIGWSVEQARACPEISRVIVSTDHPEIAKVARDFGAEVPFVRPAELASDAAGKWGVWVHALDFIEHELKWPVDLFVDLDCTSPLRRVDDIRGAIAQMLRDDVDCVFSVCEARKNPYFNLVEYEGGYLRMSKPLPGRVLRRQDAPRVLEHVASIYVLRPAYLRSAQGLMDGRARGFEMLPERSLDIDSELDFRLIECLMKDRAASAGPR
jgi:CMP-N,N'-diacetyllegionaminic acid synthase